MAPKSSEKQNTQDNRTPKRRTIYDPIKL